MRSSLPIDLRRLAQHARHCAKLGLGMSPDECGRVAVLLQFAAHEADAIVARAGDVSELEDELLAVAHDPNRAEPPAQSAYQAAVKEQQRQIQRELGGKAGECLASRPRRPRHAGPRQQRHGVAGGAAAAPLRRGRRGMIKPFHTLPDVMELGLLVAKIQSGSGADLDIDWAVMSLFFEQDAYVGWSRRPANEEICSPRAFSSSIDATLRTMREFLPETTWMLDAQDQLPARAIVRHGEEFKARSAPTPERALLTAFLVVCDQVQRATA